MDILVLACLDEIHLSFRMIFHDECGRFDSRPAIVLKNDDASMALSNPCAIKSHWRQAGRP